MSITAVLKEIASVERFFESRDDSGDVSGLQKSFADSVLNKLKQIKDFGACDGAQVYAALKGAQFGATQTQRIRDSVDALLEKNAAASASAAPSAGKQGGGGGKQLLKCWWNYFTQAELDFLKGCNSINAKMTCMVERAMAVGCTKPEEDTYRWCMAMLLLCHYQHVPTPKEIYAKIQDLKKAWLCEAKPFFLDHIEEFPEMPEHLPPKVFKHAYPEAGPVSVKFAGINTVAESVPLRKNAKVLKGNKTRAETTALDEAYTDAKSLASQPSKPCKMERVKQEPEVKSEPASDGEDDDDVIILKKEFELKLAKLRAVKKEPVVKTEPVERLVVKRNPEGGLTTQRVSAKAELPATTHEPQGGVPDVPPTEADLDPWTRAAMKAFEKRDGTKKEDAKKARAEEKDDDPEDDESDGARKRPAAASKTKGKKAKKEIKTEPKKKAGKNGPKKKVMKTKKEIKAEPKKAVKKEAPAEEVPKAKILAAMPRLPGDGSSPKPVRYWGGIIYTAAKAKKFRALRVAGDRWSEASASWGADKPTKAAWAKCVKAINDHHKK